MRPRPHLSLPSWGILLTGSGPLALPAGLTCLLTLLPSPEVAGRLLAAEASTHVLVFSMEGRLPPNSELVQAVLRLFQEPVPKAALRRLERLSPHGARVRVTVEWLRIHEDSSNRTYLVDSWWGGRGRAASGEGRGLGCRWAQQGRVGGGWRGVGGRGAVGGGTGWVALRGEGGGGGGWKGRRGGWQVG